MKRINSLEDVLTVGDQVNVKIIKLTKHDQKIGLSIKNVQDNELAQRIKLFNFKIKKKIKLG